MYNSVIECVKVSNIFIGLKRTCLGVLERGDRDKNNEIGLKEGGVIEMSTTVLHSRAAPSLCIYLPLSNSASIVDSFALQCGFHRNEKRRKLRTGSHRNVAHNTSNNCGYVLTHLNTSFIATLCAGVKATSI